ncbi:unnamed protein product [Prunus brigantina]
MIYGRLSTPTKGRTNLKAINREFQLIQRASTIPSFTLSLYTKRGKVESHKEREERRQQLGGFGLLAAMEMNLFHL